MRLLTVFILIAVCASSLSVIVKYSNPYVLTCPLDGVKYPEWRGPSTLRNPLTALGGHEVSEVEFSIVNEKDLRINSVFPKHDGTYTCSDGSKTESIKLIVYYNTELYQISASQTANDYGYMDFTCRLNSNPDSVIEWQSVQKYYRVTKRLTCTTNSTTFISVQFLNICEISMRIPNVTKEDNGKPVSCKFTYSDGNETTTKVMTSQMTYEFAPTKVSLSKTQYSHSGETMYKLVCAADLAYPKPTLEWRKTGTDELMNYLSQKRDNAGDYNGFEVSSEINVDEDTLKEGLKCCAVHKRLRKPLCNLSNVSGAVSMTTHLLMTVSCLLMSSCLFNRDI